MALALRPQRLCAARKAAHIKQLFSDIRKIRLNLLPGPDFTVSVDHDRLMQVLTNLLLNAA